MIHNKEHNKGRDIQRGQTDADILEMYDALQALWEKYKNQGGEEEAASQELDRSKISNKKRSPEQIEDYIRAQSYLRAKNASKEFSDLYDRYTVRIIESLQNLIFASAYAYKHRTSGPDFEDCVSEAKLQVLRALARYNPHTSRPTSYFAIFIDGGVRVGDNKNDRASQHYRAAERKLRDAAAEAYPEVEDISQIEDVRLCEISGLPLKTVIRTKEIMRNSQLASLDTDDSREVSDLRDTPEQALLKKEEYEYLFSLVETLSPLEATIIKWQNGVEEPIERTREKFSVLQKRESVRKDEMTLREIMSYINLPKYRERFGIKAPLSQQDIGVIASRALRKLQRSSGAKYFGEYKRTPSDGVVIEQAPMDVIENHIVDLFED